MTSSAAVFDQLCKVHGQNMKSLIGKNAYAGYENLTQFPATGWVERGVGECVEERQLR